MKQTASALIALALGVGLAAAAQAQGTNTPSAAPAPNSTLQSTAPAPNAQAQQSTQMQPPQVKKHRLAKATMSQRSEIRQVQLRLKSAGLLRGKVTGKMDPQTRIALLRFEQRNGLPRTTNLARVNRMLGTQQTRIAHARMPKSQTTGVGSSMPNTKNTSNAPLTPPTTNPAPAGAGGTASMPSTTAPATKPSSGTSK
jgi:peptidoglycan hydrolase-like protein with peptidoglycan-binding domain